MKVKDMTPSQIAGRAAARLRYRKRHAKELIERRRKYRLGNYERVLALHRRHRELNPEYYKKDRQQYQLKFRDKYFAHQAVYKAVKSGKMIRPDHCTSCGLVCKPQAHHRDYSKHLDVMWLCPPCHGLQHAGRTIERQAKGEQR